MDVVQRFSRITNTTADDSIVIRAQQFLSNTDKVFDSSNATEKELHFCKMLLLSINDGVPKELQDKLKDKLDAIRLVYPSTNADVSYSSSTDTSETSQPECVVGLRFGHNNFTITKADK